MIIAKVKTDGLHLREGPGKDYPYRDILTKGDRLRVLSGLGGWSLVEVVLTKSGQGEGQRGWVWDNAIERSDVGQPAPEQEPVFPQWVWWSCAGVVAAIILVLFLI